MAPLADFEKELHELVEGAKAAAQADMKKYVDDVLKKFDSSLNPTSTLPYAVVILRDALRGMDGDATVAFDLDAAIERIAAAYGHSDERPPATVPASPSESAGSLAGRRQIDGVNKNARNRVKPGSDQRTPGCTMYNTGFYRDSAAYVMNNPRVRISVSSLYDALHETHPNITTYSVYRFFVAVKSGRTRLTPQNMEYGYGWIMYSPPTEGSAPVNDGLPHGGANGAHEDTVPALSVSSEETGTPTRYSIPQAAPRPPAEPEIPVVRFIQDVYDECPQLAPIYRGIEPFHTALLGARRALKTQKTRDAFYKALQALESANAGDVNLGGRRTDFLGVMAAKGDDAYPLLEWINARKGVLKAMLDERLLQYGAHVERSYPQPRDDAPPSTGYGFDRPQQSNIRHEGAGRRR